MDLRVLVALPFSEKHLITFYRAHHPIIHQKGSAPALANPAKSKTKIQESLAQYYQKMNP